MLRAPTVQDMCFWAAAFERCPLPDGNGVAIITNAGGPAIMAADACSRSGLELPELSSRTRDRLAEFLPPAAALGNPVDMIASSGPREYRRARTCSERVRAARERGSLRLADGDAPSDVETRERRSWFEFPRLQAVSQWSSSAPRYRLGSLLVASPARRGHRARFPWRTADGKCRLKPEVTV